VVDVSDPGSPRIVGTTDLEGFFRGVDVCGGYVLVAELHDGLVVIDVADRANPRVASSLPTPGGAICVRVSGTCAYVACHTASDIAMVDVSDPQHPTMIGLVGVTDMESYGIRDVAVAGTYACVATPLNGLHVIDVTNPRTAPVLGTFVTRGSRLAVAGDHAYVAGGSDSLTVVDVSHPDDPRVLSSVGAPGYCSDIDVAGSHAFVAGSYRPPRTGGYLVAIDVTDPVHPETADVVDLPDVAYLEYCVAVSGSLAIVAGGTYYGDAHLRVIEVSDPWDLHVVGEISLPASPADVVLSGDHPFVADAGAGVLAVDVSVPSSPRIVGSARIQDFSAMGIDVLGQTACVALDGGVQVIDVSQPQDLRTVGLMYHAWAPHRVSMRATYAAITDRYAGVLLVDLVNPWSPRILGGVAGYGDMLPES
jgi:hypothetical protein